MQVGVVKRQGSALRRPAGLYFQVCTFEIKGGRESPMDRVDHGAGVELAQRADGPLYRSHQRTFLN